MSSVTAVPEPVQNQPVVPIRQAGILCVDDEPNVLVALRRLFHAQGYRVLTAQSGQIGLQMLEVEPVDLVISDMRMPEMDGARFLEQVRARRPDTVRLLLTGYADTQSILDAINRDEIYRYVTKLLALTPNCSRLPVLTDPHGASSIPHRACVC